MRGPCGGSSRRNRRRWCILGRVQAGNRPSGGVCVAVDVHYLPSGGAQAAAVVAADATFCRLLPDRTGQVAGVPPYHSGQFYLRELPPLHAVLDGLDGMRLLIVDGYTDLDPGGRPGLGAHAHAEFGVPVIGVAKTAFRTATHALPVVRGERSARPLFITATGMSAIRPQTWSATWQAATGYPTLFAVPTLLPAAASPDHDAPATDTLIAA